MDDPAYKRLLTHQRIVKDLLIGFIAPQRPSGWAGAFDFDTLREGPTENVTDELRRRLGDVVWSIDRRDGRGGVHTCWVSRNSAVFSHGNLDTILFCTGLPVAAGEISCRWC